MKINDYKDCIRNYDVDTAFVTSWVVYLCEVELDVDFTDYDIEQVLTYVSRDSYSLERLSSEIESIVEYITECYLDYHS